jgi:hypothetical protein
VIAENEQHRQSITNVAQREASNREVAAAYTGLAEARLRTGDIPGALEVMQGYRTGATRRAAAAPPLPPGTGMLITAFLGGGVAVWYADRDTVIHHWAMATWFGLPPAGSRKWPRIPPSPRNWSNLPPPG